jgi:signal transduction histidine kinase
MEQTIDRVAAPRAGQGSCMSAPSSRVERFRPTHDLHLALLPVRSGRELALGLARQWQDWSGAQVAIVALGFTHLGRKWIARSESGKLPEVAESSFDRAQVKAGFPDCVRASTLPGDPKIAAVLPFSTKLDAIGGVLLCSVFDLELPAQACESFTALSSKLVDQAEVVEAGFGGRRALEAAKAEAIAEFAAGAGHEINNPLATIAGRVQMLLRDESNFNHRQDLATIGAQSLRIRDMIGDLMLFGRPPAPTPKRLVLNDLVQSVVDRSRKTQRKPREIDLELAADGPIFATADPAQLEIVLNELVRNGLDAIDGASHGDDGKIVIRLERSGSTGSPAAIVSVTDNGPGLSDKDRVHLFDPYYSGREAGRGLGFGLCKCWRIVSGHGGRIEVDSVPGVATTFRVFLPDATVDRSDGSSESQLANS